MALLPPGSRLSFRTEYQRLPSVRSQRGLLLPGSLIQVVLHQLPQQLASQLFEPGFQFVMRHVRCRAVAQRRIEALEGITGGQVRIRFG